MDTTNVIAMDAFVAGIRDGSVSLAVRQDSGWYDRQQSALEPFLRPETTTEARHVTWGEAYRQRMEQLFRGALALARETHIKNLEVESKTAAGPRPEPVRVTVTPALTVEPHPTAWLRRADAYRYVRNLLERVFGKEGLESMRRMTPDGPVTIALGEELKAFETLFLGAYGRACLETGTPAGGMAGLDVAETAFTSWAQQTATDPDLARDVRMMVPVSTDPAGRVRVWCFLGWATDDLDDPLRDAAGRHRPTSHRHRRDHGARPEVTFAPQTVRAAYPVFAETWTTKVLDRAEFRRLCDEKQTRGRDPRGADGAPPQPDPRGNRAGHPEREGGGRGARRRAPRAGEAPASGRRAAGGRAEGRAHGPSDAAQGARTESIAPGRAAVRPNAEDGGRVGVDRASGKVNLCVRGPTSARRARRSGSAGCGPGPPRRCRAGSRA